MYESVVRRIIPENVATRIENDAAIGLYSGTHGRPGISVIAGTGSIVVGMSQDRKLLRTGGWGYLAGDRGSAFAIGQKALEAALMAHDGLGASTVLEDRICTHFAVESLEETVSSLYRSSSPTMVIAALAREVDEAAESGDGVAKRILKEAADDLAFYAPGCLRQLKLDDRDKRVVLIGSVSSSSSFRRWFQEALQEKDGGVDFIRPLMRPVCGAIIMGLELIPIRVDQMIIERLTTWSMNTSKYW